MVIKPKPPHKTRTEQQCFKLQNEHHQITSAAKTTTHSEQRYVQSQIHITKYIKKVLNTKQPMKSTTHIGPQWSQNHNIQRSKSINVHLIQQDETTHHTKHITTLHKGTLIALQNKASNVVIHQHSSRIMKMDIFMSKTC